jgi:hypothetical protein
MALGCCWKCDSPRIRRAHAHSALKRMVGTLTPYRRYQCELCGHRGWTLATLPSRHHDRTGRPVESRDVQARQKATWRLVLLVGLSLLLGLLVARMAAPEVRDDGQTRSQP